MREYSPGPHSLLTKHDEVVYFNMKLLTEEQMIAKCKEFDRHIKEARRAAQYSLTLEEKLICIGQAKTLQEQKLKFKADWIKANFNDKVERPR